MTFDSTPWMIGGGALHNAEVGRLLAFASTSGSEGVVSPGDLKVIPYSVPGNGVRVVAGAGLVLNRYPGGAQQTYVVRNPTEDTIADIPATTSAGGRSDLIVARILDPQYPGGPAVPADPRNFQYVESYRIPNVPATTTSARELNLNYPAIALARIDLGTSDGTVTAEKIVDLRQLALPRERREIFVNPLADEQLLARSSFTDWGSYRPQVRVPQWATHAHMIVTLSGIVVQGGNITGYLRSMFGALPSEAIGYDFNLTSAEGSAGDARQMFMIAFGADVRQYQGTLVTLKVQGYRDNAGENGYLRAFGVSSHIAYDVQFSERVV